MDVLVAEAKVIKFPIEEKGVTTQAGLGRGALTREWTFVTFPSALHCFAQQPVSAAASWQCCPADGHEWTVLRERNAGVNAGKGHSRAAVMQVTVLLSLLLMPPLRRPRCGRACRSRWPSST